MALGVGLHVGIGALGGWRPTTTVAAALTSHTVARSVTSSLRGSGGVALYLNAAGLTPGTIATIPDTSGNALDFTKDTGTDPTAEAAGGPNGQSDVRFDVGTYVKRGSSPFAALTACDAFIVQKFDNASTADASTNVPWYLSAAVANDLWKYSVGPALYCGVASTTRAARGNPSQDLTQWHVGRVTSTATEYTINVGAQQLYTDGTNTVGFPATCVVGGGLVGGGSTMKGNIAIVALFDHKLSAAELTSFKAGLAARFGALPGT